jgi:hypothetical protein
MASAICLEELETLKTRKGEFVGMSRLVVVSAVLTTSWEYHVTGDARIDESCYARF